MAAPEEGFWQPVIDAAAAAGSGKLDDAKLLLARVPEEANADYLAAAGRVSLLAREMGMARTYFTRALERDPSSYRAALGVATTVLLQRDFDLASRAFDAARSRTRDKNEQKFLTYAIGDLATIKVR
jgi:Tfp pilus assembly protein PilF